MFSKYTAGISVGLESAHIALLEVKRRGVLLRLLEEIPKAGSGSDKWFLDPVLNRTKKIYKKIKKISIALDPSSVNFHSFPMDTSLTRQEQTEHLEWELSNFISNYQPATYVNEVKYLRTHAREQVADVLTVTVPKQHTLDIQNMLSERKIELHAVDTAFFCAQYALLTSNPEIKTQTIALLYVSGGRLDLGIMREGHLVFYRYTIVDGAHSAEDFIREFLESSSVTALYVAGPTVPPDFIARVQQETGLPVQLLNPIEHFPASRKFRDRELFTGQEHRFAAAIGCALIKD